MMMEDGLYIHFNQARMEKDDAYVRFLLQIIGDVREWEESR